MHQLSKLFLTILLLYSTNSSANIFGEIWSVITGEGQSGSSTSMTTDNTIDTLITDEQWYIDLTSPEKQTFDIFSDWVFGESIDYAFDNFDFGNASEAVKDVIKGYIIYNKDYFAPSGVGINITYTVGDGAWDLNGLNVLGDKLNYISVFAEDRPRELFPDYDKGNGRADYTDNIPDAFRHAYSTALFTKALYLQDFWGLSIMTANEAEPNNNTPFQIAMDLHNNFVGWNTYRSLSSNDQNSNLIIERSIMSLPYVYIEIQNKTLEQVEAEINLANGQLVFIRPTIDITTIVVTSIVIPMLLL